MGTGMGMRMGLGMAPAPGRLLGYPSRCEPGERPHREAARGCLYSTLHNQRRRALSQYGHAAAVRPLPCKGHLSLGFAFVRGGRPCIASQRGGLRWAQRGCSPPEPGPPPSRWREEPSCPASRSVCIASRRPHGTGLGGADLAVTIPNPRVALKRQLWQEDRVPAGAAVENPVLGLPGSPRAPGDAFAARAYVFSSCRGRLEKFSLPPSFSVANSNRRAGAAQG